MDTRNWKCSCPNAFCPGNRIMTRYFGQNWYGVCESVSSLAPEDYSDLQNRYAPGSVEYLRTPYYGQQYMHGGLSSPDQPASSSASSVATVAGPSGTQPGSGGQGGYQANEAMGYPGQGGQQGQTSGQGQQGSSWETWPDNPIPGPGMSSSGHSSKAGSVASGKASSHRSRKGKGKSH